MKAFNGFALAAVLSFVFFGPAQAQPAACHSLAASPADPARKGPGVPYSKIDGARAASACKAAVMAQPKDGQLWFQYGRALEKTNNVSEAIEAYRKGSDLNNPGALNNLGVLYRDGKGVTRNYYLAEIYFHNAANQDFPEAIQNLKGMEKHRLPESARTIPVQLRGKFSLPDQTCQQTREVMKAFGGSFMGVEVQALDIDQTMEMSCRTMAVNIENAQQAKAILMCNKNSPDVMLVEATIRPDGLQFQYQGGARSASVRCR